MAEGERVEFDEVVNPNAASKDQPKPTQDDPKAAETSDKEAPALKERPIKSATTM